MQEITLNLQSAGSERLDEFLRREVPNAVVVELPRSGSIETTNNTGITTFSNSKIRRLIISGAVSVNGRVVMRPAFELRGKSGIKVCNVRRQDE